MLVQVEYILYFVEQSLKHVLHLIIVGKSQNFERHEAHKYFVLVECLIIFLYYLRTDYISPKIIDVH